MISTPTETEDLRLINYTKYSAVIFDCFGTILNIKHKKNPYYHYLKRQGIRDVNIYNSIMKNNLKLEDLSPFLGIVENEELLKESKQLLDFELSNIVMFEDAKDVLSTLDKSVKILICSNLAQPYHKPISNINCLKILSYEVGFIKPEIEIYSMCLEKLNVKPNETLFVGDNFISDYLAPKKIGMNSCWLNRKK